MAQNPRLLAALVVMGAVWGLTIPLSKHSVVAGGYQHFGLVFWQMVFTGLTLSVLVARRGRMIRMTRERVFMALAIAFTGTLIPGSAGYRAAAELPAGVMAIIISLVPMFALAIAVAMRNEQFHWPKLMGVIFGAIAIVLLIGPENSLPEVTKVSFVFLAMIAPLCYGIEDNVVSRFGLFGLTAVEMLFLSSILGLIVLTPVVLASGQMIPLWSVDWGTPELAIVAVGVSHAVAYVGYIWMVGRAGPVFASQVAYLVTAFGVVWSMLLLGESYSGWFWTALVVLMLGLFLVRPRDAE